MTRRRRAVLLVEMITVLFMLSIGGSLMAVGLASIMRSQRRVAELDNRYAMTNDFLRCLFRDVRKATTASLREGDGAELQQVLVVGEFPRQVSYRFYKQHVERTGFEGDSQAAKLWSPMTADIGVTPVRSVVGNALVDVTVFWGRTDAQDPEPNRRFDLAVRCAGELDHDEN